MNKSEKQTKIQSLCGTIIICFCPLFMLLIFGPAEIYFLNVTEFNYIYQEFAIALAIAAMIGTIIFTTVLQLINKKVANVLLSILCGISVASYLQVMFFNKDLDLLGVSAEYYKPSNTQIIGNSVVWIVVIVSFVLLGILGKKNSKKIMAYLCGILVAVQMLAYISMLFNAEDVAYKYPDGAWRLAGENQYTVSSKENVIVLILDMFSNDYLDKMVEEYPDALDCMHDFTYYSNVECNYYGTFPSIAHMVTGQSVDMEIGVNEWASRIWTCDDTKQYIDDLHNNNYVMNLYTPDCTFICGDSDITIMGDAIGNITNAPNGIDVFYKRLFIVMSQMSSFRMAPEGIKCYLYSGLDKYSTVVEYLDDSIMNENYAFYDRLLSKRLNVDNSSNYLIFQHLVGTHRWDTDEWGQYTEEKIGVEETARGCFRIVEEYLTQLQELGVYDNSTIIVTADHGTPACPQPIFFIKQQNDQSEHMQINNAPISFDEFRDTIAVATGLDSTKYNNTIYQFKEDEQRQRIHWLRFLDDSYPNVPCRVKERDASSNVYYGYYYEGDKETLKKMIGEDTHNPNKPSVIIPMIESFF